MHFHGSKTIMKRHETCHWSESIWESLPAISSGDWMVGDAALASSHSNGKIIRAAADLATLKVAPGGWTAPLKWAYGRGSGNQWQSCHKTHQTLRKVLCNHRSHGRRSEWHRLFRSLSAAQAQTVYRCLRAQTHPLDREMAVLRDLATTNPEWWPISWAKDIAWRTRILWGLVSYCKFHVMFMFIVIAIIYVYMCVWLYIYIYIYIYIYVNVYINKCYLCY